MPSLKISVTVEINTPKLLAQTHIPFYQKYVETFYQIMTLYQGIRTIVRRKLAPPVRVRIWVRVSVSFRVGDNFSRGQLSQNPVLDSSNFPPNISFIIPAQILYKGNDAASNSFKQHDSHNERIEKYIKKSLTK